MRGLQEVKAIAWFKVKDIPSTNGKFSIRTERGLEQLTLFRVSRLHVCRCPGSSLPLRGCTP